MINRNNPFGPIYDICNRGSSQEKLEDIIDFPRYIDIELTNKCNYKCLMCPTGIRSLKREKGYMADKTYYKILEEAEKHGTPMRFIGWGEPTLHKKLLDYLNDAKKSGLLCHINTSGSLMTEALADKLLNIPIDSIKFSFQGVDSETYLEVRRADLFDDLVGKVKMFYEKRGYRRIPYIHVSTTITYESKVQVEAFKSIISKSVDLVTVGRTHFENITDKSKLSESELSTLNKMKRTETIIKRYHECAEVFDKFTVNWDGTASACCNDCDKDMVIGDTKISSIGEIWHSKEMGFYRQMLAQMRHDELSVCSRCYDFMSLQMSGIQNI